MLQSIIPLNLLLADPFWTRKIITDPYIPAQANTECPDDTYPKLYIYISEPV